MAKEHSWGQKSQVCRASLRPELQLFADRLLERYEGDLSIIWGHRGQKAQHQAFITKKSRVDWPNSKHNKVPSDALDIVPYPIDWDDHAAFYRLHEVAVEVAEELGFIIIWGGDWDNDGDYSDQTFNDLAHYQWGGFLEKK